MLQGKTLTQRSRNQTTLHEGHEGHEERQEEHEKGPFFFVSSPPNGRFFVHFAFFVNSVSDSVRVRIGLDVRCDGSGEPSQKNGTPRPNAASGRSQTPNPPVAERTRRPRRKRGRTRSEAILLRVSKRQSYRLFPGLRALRVSPSPLAASRRCTHATHMLEPKTLRLNRGLGGPDNHQSGSRH